MRKKVLEIVKWFCAGKRFSEIEKKTDASRKLIYAVIFGNIYNRFVEKYRNNTLRR